MTEGYEVTVDVADPMALGTNPEAGNLVDCHDHLPGSVVRGALAAAWIIEHQPPLPGSADLPAFVDLFERALRYGPLLAEYTARIPIGVIHCKRQPEPDCDTWAFDGAVDGNADLPSRCPICQGPLEPGRGELALSRQRPSLHHTRTRVALGLDETALPEQLFSRKAITQGNRFTGQIAGRHPWLDALAASGPLTVRLGGRRSVGARGRLSLTAVKHRVPQLRSDGTVIIRLDSPAVLVDAAGGPTLSPDPADLAAVLGREVTDTRGWTRPTVIGGWHMASGLPKPQDIAVAAGSTYSITTAMSVDIDHLAALEQAGVGLRRPEGYGWVTVNPAPWVPPVAPDLAPHDAGGFDLDALYTEVRDQFRDRSERRWLAGLLRQTATAAEGSGTAPTLELRRSRHWTDSQRNVADRMVAIPDPRHLKALVYRLEGP